MVALLIIGLILVLLVVPFCIFMFLCRRGNIALDKNPDVWWCVEGRSPFTSLKGWIGHGAWPGWAFWLIIAIFNLLIGALLIVLFIII